MKKVFTIGLLALAISASAKAKNVVKPQSVTSYERLRNWNVKQKQFDYTIIITSCGGVHKLDGIMDVPSMLEMYDVLDFYDCNPWWLPYV